MSLHYRGTPEDRAELYKEAIGRTFEERFFDIAFGNPDPQFYRIGWLTEDIPHIDLYIGRSLPEEEIQKLGHDRRDVEINAMIHTENAWKLAGLEAIGESGIFEDFSIENEEDGGRPYRNLYFRIQRPHTSGRIRNTLLKLAAALEKAGFRNNGQLKFDWIKAVDMNDFGFAEHDSSVQVMRMEAEEEAHGPEINVSQAKQAIAKILEKRG
ncbi:MAG: hypothetical protein QG650_1068 [Patescibacteria group bacterium]|nr:hypothetical protein [Patescibacteria group bacterium]